MDFGNYPPEINSARMYAGAGGGDRCSPPPRPGKRWPPNCIRWPTRISRWYRDLTTGPWQGPASTSMSCRGGVVRRVAAGHRRAGRGDRRPGQVRGRRLPSGLHGDGVAGDGRGQPHPVDDPDRDQCVRQKHPGDRGERSAVRPDVGPGRRGDVRLRGLVVLRDTADTVQPAPTEHQPRRHCRTVSRGQPGHRHGGRQRAEHDPAGFLRGAERAAGRFSGRGARRHRPAEHDQPT